MPQAAARRHEVRRLRRVLVRLHYPRLQMALIVAITGAGGFLCSFLLLHAGVASMAWRYGLAVAFAYGVFLGLLWWWLRVRRDLLDALDTTLDGLDLSASSAGERAAPARDAFGTGGDFGGGGATTAFDYESTEPAIRTPVKGSGDGDVDWGELGLIIAILLALGAAILAAFWIISGAPALFAELLLDAGLAAGLYKRLRTLERRYWLSTAVGKTALPFLAVGAAFVVAGALIQHQLPEARSIGDLLGAARNVR
jgi:hypothetical protein